MYVLFAFNKNKCGFVGENDTLTVSSRTQHKFKNLQSSALKESQAKLLTAGYRVELLQNPDEKLTRGLLNENKKAYKAIKLVAKHTNRAVVPTVQHEDTEDTLEIIVVNLQKMESAYFSIIDNSIYAIEDLPILQQGDRIAIFDEQGKINNELVKLFQNV